MAVTLRNLMKHDWFKHTITLVTDETGLDTMVTWPYIRQTAEIGSWLNGGEMIFVFHQADTAELQIELLKEGIQAKVSAFVFLCGQMDEIFQKHFLYSEVSLYAGYSGIHRGIAETGDAVQESKNAMIFCKKSDGRKSSYHYHELGILRLLVNSNSREELQDYCSRIFGKLIQSDKINMTEYLLAVKTYLENNNNMTVTAKKLFIHRNTLLSRINKIEELTGKKLSDADVKLEFLCAFKLLEFLTEDEV